jgi:aspartyl aminopeptidase
MSAASSASSWSHLSKDDTASVRSQAPKSRGPAQGLVDFINSSPNPYFAVAHASARLESTGFTRLNEREPWSGQIKPSGRYYVVRGHTSLIAFAVGGKFKPGNGISIVGAHTGESLLRRLARFPNAIRLLLLQD